VSDIVYCGAYFLDLKNEDRIVCYVQAVLIEVGCWASYAWTTVMAAELYFVLGQRDFGTQGRMRRHHFFVWSTTFLTALLLALLDAYGPAGVDASEHYIWCWLKAGNWVPRFVIFMIPVLIECLFAISIYVIIIVRICRAWRLRLRSAVPFTPAAPRLGTVSPRSPTTPLVAPKHGTTGSRADWRILMKLGVFPLLLCVVFGVGFGHRLHDELAGGKDISFAFTLFHALTTSGQGVLHAAAFFVTNSDMRAELSRWCRCGRKRAARSTVSNATEEESSAAPLEDEEEWTLRGDRGTGTAPSQLSDDQSEAVTGAVASRPPTTQGYDDDEESDREEESDEELRDRDLEQADYAVKPASLQPSRSSFSQRLLQPMGGARKSIDSSSDDFYVGSDLPRRAQSLSAGFQGPLQPLSLNEKEGA